MNIKLITVCSHPEHAGMLITSAKNHGWDLVVIHAEWKGFGTKIIETYNYLKANPEITHFLFCDAFDTYIQGTPDELLRNIYTLPKDNPFFVDKMIFSAEKGCWPDSSLSEYYPKTQTDFKYLNSGVYFAPVVKWMHMVNAFMPKYEDDDQLYFTEKFLGNFGWHIELDTYQRYFNSHSFIADEEYIYDENTLRIHHKESSILHTPIVIHFNGKTVDPIFNERIKI